MTSEMSEAERRFTPSQWVKRMNPADVVGAHVKFVSEESAAAVSHVPNEIGIPYGSSSARDTLDLYGADLPKNSPILVYVSGGYWQELSGKISAYAARTMYDEGIVTVVPDYDRAPGGTNRT